MNAQLSKYDTVIKALMSNGCKIHQVTHPHTPYQKDIMRCEFKAGLEDYLSGTTAYNNSLEKIIHYYGANEQRLLSAALTIETYCSPLFN